MSDWTNGYVADVEYVPGFYREQTPVHLDLVCLLQGLEPPRRGGGTFRYCELGCGIGETALTIAAANPQSEVWAFDFNPSHIARGAGMAGAAGLANAHIEEASFEELAHGDRPELGMFDYITLHGVWAWVSPANRSFIVEFIRRHLKPGGLAYVTYNALPGWTTAMPLQRLLSVFASAMPDRSDRRIPAALDAAAAFAGAGAGSVAGEMLEWIDKAREKDRLAYLSHEYLNANWAPCYQMDVARELAGAKLSFAGAAGLFENFPDLSLTAAQRELVARAPPAAEETAKDYFLARTFRRDVYVRGARALPERRLEDRVRALRLALVIPEKTVTRDIDVPLGKAALSERFYRPALEALAEAPRTVGELIDLPEAGGSVTPREVVGMLVGSRQAMILDNDLTEEGRNAATGYNRTLISACADEGRANCFLAGAASGSGHVAQLFDMLAYEALIEGTPPQPDALADAVSLILARRGDQLRHQGEVIEDEAGKRRVIGEQIGDVIDVSLPIWKHVGAI